MWLIFYFCVILFKDIMFGCPICQITLETQSQGTVTSEDTVNIQDYYTNLAPYGFTVNTSVKFELKACRDSCILLSDSYDLQSNVLYEVCYAMIGRMIRLYRKYPDGTTSFYDEFQTMILNCDVFTTIWAFWTDGTIYVGTGNDMSAQNKIFSHHDPDPFVVRGVGIKTGFTIDGTWKVNIPVFTTGYYCGLDNIRGNMTRLEVFTQRIRTLCALECQRNDACLGFNYKADGYDNCELIAGNEAIVKVPTTNWRFYTKCLQDKKVCLGCMF